jgi:hypothetical protein
MGECERAGHESVSAVYRVKIAKPARASDAADDQPLICFWSSLFAGLHPHPEQPPVQPSPRALVFTDFRIQMYPTYAPAKTTIARVIKESI